RVADGQPLETADRRTAEDQLESHRVEAADAERERQSVRDGYQRHGPAIEGDVEASRDSHGVRAWVDPLLPRLVCGNLGEIEHVAHVEAVACDLDAGEVIDREIAEWMRLRRCGCEQSGRQAGQNEQALHDRAPRRATGAHRI